MLGTAELVAFVPTSDLTRARAFYEGVLGLRVLDEDPYAVLFEANGTTIRATLVEAATPQPFTVLGWTVPDVRATVEALNQQGVSLEHFERMGQDDLRIWTAPSGARVAWFKDPDANLLSVTQLD